MKKNIRIGIGQMNPTVGDFQANTRRVLDWIRLAEKENADLLVFPEMTLSGYPIWDLANKPAFIEQSCAALKEIAQSTRGKKITAVVGYVGEPDKKGGRSYNAMAWIRNGKIQATYFKRLLPTYDVFLEDIFFERGTSSRVISWNGLKIGPTICEDLWDSRYAEKPLADLCRQKAEMIVNMSASPFYGGVLQKRLDLLQSHCKKYKVPILYVNQVGAQDDLIFDGRSMFVDAKGRLLFLAPMFKEGLFYFDWDQCRSAEAITTQKEGHDKIQETYEALVLGVRDYCRKNGFPQVIIGLSGGIDSSLVAAIAADALGPEAVTGVAMPSEFSSQGSLDDARDLAQRLRIDFRIHPIKDIYSNWMKNTRARADEEGRAAGGEKKITLAMENLQARLRGLNLMYLSNDEGRLLLSTGNKSEMAMGYCTLYGDMAGGLSVIGDVYKTDVYRLCHYRNQVREVIPKSVIDKAPSAELRPNQKDQDTLPPYDILDEILYLYIEKNQSRKVIAKTLAACGVPAAVVTETIRKVDHNEYKRRQAAPILRVTEKAWFGRRMPITNRFPG